MNYPDPKTKLTSQSELVELMGERDSRGQRRYETDEHFRRIVEQKVANGYLYNDGPEVRGSFEQSFTVSELDHQNTREVLGLRRDRDALQLQVEAAERDALVQASKGVEGVEAPKVTPFASREEMMRALGSTEHRSNAAVRQHNEARVAASDFDSFDIRIGH